MNRMRTIAARWLLCSIPLVIDGSRSLAASAGPEQDFSKPGSYSISAINGAPEPSVIEEEKPGPTGRPAWTFRYQSPKENAGVRLTWSFPSQTLDGEVFQVHLHTSETPVAYVTVRFRAPDGKQVCRHTYFGARADSWRPFTFVVGGRGRANYFEPKGRFTPGAKVSTISIAFTGRKGTSNSVTVSDFCLAGSRDAAARPGRPATTPTVQHGETKLWLDAERGYAFAGADVAGRWLEPNPSVAYPSLKCIDGAGKQRLLSAGDDELAGAVTRRSGESISLTYSLAGTVVQLTWTARPDRLRCGVAVVSEGEVKVDSVGHDTIFGVALGPDDYGIVPDGHLVRPALDQPFAFHRFGNADNTVPNFTAAKVGDRIVYCNPLTYSQQMHMQTQIVGGDNLVYLGAALYFRPPDFRNPATRLVHKTLGWQIELAGDENRDGDVDWVDCGIAYRDRYVPPNPAKSDFMRDSYRFYHQHGPDPGHYHDLCKAIETMDFATGVWWVKGAMVCIDRTPSEKHPYRVERSGMGDKLEAAERIRKTGSRVGIYYGHDYITLDWNDWPEELIKLDAQGRPHRYGRHHVYKDNVRGLATGKLLEHYERIIDTVRLQPGDPVQLDTFTAYARPGYHPDYPATPQTETEAKREIARWFKYDKKLIIAGEAIIEGTQDVVDYGSIVYKLHRLGQFWKTGFPRKYVPLETVVYHGSTYCGTSWYELRRRTPNWASIMAVCGGYWTWDSVMYPEHIYAKTARDFFNSDIFWAQIADRKIADIDQVGTAYTIGFDDGSTVWTDPGESRHSFWLDKGGIRYDGFTPFSVKGVMAILKQGDFDITLPFKDDLEVLPSQPHRSKLDVAITKTDDGFTRVRGNFSRTPWKLPYLHNVGDKEVVDLIDVEPVLMLRRKSPIK